jgi:two-component sensor histidine kinase
VFIGQLLTWVFIVHPPGAIEPPTTQISAGLVIATISQLLTVAMIALYQSEVDKGTVEREQRLALLDEALKEIDHRTRNNYQTVLALIELQSRRAADDGVRDALRQVLRELAA